MRHWALLVLAIACGLSFAQDTQPASRPAASMPAVDGQLRDPEWPYFGGELRRTTVASTPAVDGQLRKPEWPWLGGDLRRSTAADGPVIKRYPTVRWEVSIRPFRSSYCAPAVGYGHVYVLAAGDCGTMDNRLLCLRVSDGMQRWAVNTDGSQDTTSPGLADGKVLWPAGQSYLVCLGALNGAKNWRLRTTVLDNFRCAPLVVNGLVTVASRECSFYGVDMKTGKKLWEYASKGRLCASHAIHDGRIVFGERDKFVTCISLKTGKQLWRTETGDWPDATPSIDHGLVFTGGRDGQVFALELATGKKRWTFKTGGYIRGPMPCRDGLVLVGSYDRCVYALDTRTGKLRWKYTAPARIRGCLLIAGPLVYVGDGGGNLAALRFADGKRIWRVQLGHALLSPPATDGKALYVVDEGVPAGKPFWNSDIMMRNGSRFLCVADGTDDPKLLAEALSGVSLGILKDEQALARRIAALVAQLGSESFREREAAEAALEKIGGPAVPALRKAATESDDAEICFRAEGLAERLPMTPPPLPPLAPQLGLDHDVPYLLHWLEAAEAKTRAAVHRRLAAVLDPLPHYDPHANTDQRAARQTALRQWWTARKAGLRWDAAAGKYVPKPQ